MQRFGEAREQLQIALPLLERVYGASDGETLRAMGHLAWLQWRSGDHSAAKRLEDVVEQLVATSVSAARADVEGLWARVVWTRDRARGRALAERALQALQSHAPHMRHEAAALEQWLHDQPR